MSTSCRFQEPRSYHGVSLRLSQELAGFAEICSIAAVSALSSSAHAMRASHIESDRIMKQRQTRFPAPDDVRWRLPPDNLLASSREQRWSGIMVERRRHSAGEIPELISNDSTVIGLAVAGNPGAIIHRRGNGIVQATPALTGTIWLCPQHAFEDSIRITGVIPEMLHIYLSAGHFAALAQEDHYPEIRPERVSYEAGFQNPLIGQIGQAILSELAVETSSGRLLVEASALMLAAELVHRYFTVTLPHAAAAATAQPHALDRRRLHRVLAFIDANLESDFGVEDIAAVACLSQFHFSRAFKKATGKSPYQFVSERRLEKAKMLLRQGDAGLAEIAVICNFSSQANFARAFRRAMGVSPGSYRRSCRVRRDHFA